MASVVVAPLKKVVKSSVVIIPQPGIKLEFVTIDTIELLLFDCKIESNWTEIQEIRRVHDKSYVRWMPHINLLYPFVEAENFPQVVELLKSAIANIKPFKLTFEEIKYFEHKSSCTMWLQPKTEPSNIVHQVQAALQQAVPYCDDLNTMSHEGFNPHLSLGQFSKKEIKEAVARFQQNWKPLSFIVSEVFVIARQGFDDPFSIHYRIPFEGNIEQRIATPVKPVVSYAPNTRLYVANLPFEVDSTRLKQFFEEHSAHPTDVIIVQSGGRSKGFGFVQFENEDEARRAMDSLDGAELSGRNITIKFAQTK